MNNDNVLIGTITVTDPKIVAHLRLIDKGIKQQNEKIAKQSARIDELETQVDYFENLLGEEEAQLARYECVGIVTGLSISNNPREFEWHKPVALGTKLFALKDEK